MKVIAQPEIDIPLGKSIDQPKTFSPEILAAVPRSKGRICKEIEPKNFQKVTKILSENNIFNEKVAIVQKDKFEILGELKIDVDDLYKVNNSWYNNY